MSAFKSHNTSFNYLPTDVFGPPGWFEFEDGDVFACAERNTPLVSHIDRLVVLDSLSTLYQHEASIWEANIDMLLRASKVSDYLLNDTVFDFYDYHQSANTSPWQFATAEVSFSVAMDQMPESLYDSVFAYHSSLIASMQLVDSLSALVIDTSLEWHSVYTILDSLFDDIQQRSISKYLLVDLIDSINAENLSNVLMLMHALPETNLYERNRKFIDILHVSMAMGDTLSESVLDTLRYIAAQDPSDGGSAVYEAIRLLPRHEQDDYLPLIDDIGNHEQIQALVHTDHLSRHINDIRVYPNPTSDHVIILYPDNLLGLSCVIYDTYGKIVVEQKRPSTGLDFRINLAGLSPGVYFARICSEKTSTTQKIIKN